MRRDLHAHPELGCAEHRTTGWWPTRCPTPASPAAAAPAPAVVRRRDRAAGPTVALRADLDALPIPDTKDVGYRSTVDGVCHACGHDVHTTVLLGGGLALAEIAARAGCPAGSGWSSSRPRRRCPAARST